MHKILANTEEALYSYSMKLRTPSEKKMMGLKLGSTTIQWDPGRMNAMVYFVGAALVVVFLMVGINAAVSAVEGLPDAKIKATVAFILVLVGLVTFLE